MADTVAHTNTNTSKQDEQQPNRNRQSNADCICAPRTQVPTLTVLDCPLHPERLRHDRLRERASLRGSRDEASVDIGLC